jgi:hypothetical protein
MVQHRFLLLLLLPPVIAGSALAEVSPADKPTPKEAANITVVMENFKGSRPAKITGAVSVLRMLISGPPRDELVKRGTVEVDRRKYTLYLARAKSYTTKNTGRSDCDNDNTSTLISVDPKGDGRLTEHDGWFANLPMRLGDRMFDVVEIAADGSRIVLKPSKAPLRGVFVGRSCPPFFFKTADGKEVSRDSLAGKAFLLDIWSIT